MQCITMDSRYTTTGSQEESIPHLTPVTVAHSTNAILFFKGEKMSTLKTRLTTAIKNKSLVTFMYDGKARYVIPLEIKPAANYDDFNLYAKEVNVDFTKAFTLSKMTNLGIVNLPMHTPKTKPTLKTTYLWADEKKTEEEILAAIISPANKYKTYIEIGDLIIRKRGEEEYEIARILRSVRVENVPA
jgi:hypothetical protein